MPDCTEAVYEHSPSTTTVWILLARKSVIHCLVLPRMP